MAAALRSSHWRRSRLSVAVVGLGCEGATNRQSTAGSASTSLSTWAGKRLAERIAGRGAGREVFKLPICDSSLPYPNVLGLVASQARRSEGSGSAFSASGNACATRSCELRSRLPTASLCGYFERRAEPGA